MNPTAIPKPFGSFFVGLYGWLLTLFSGMILFDILTSRLIPETARISSEISDFLLLIGFFVLAAAVLALVFSLLTPVRSLLIISLGLILLEFVLPVALSPFSQDPTVQAVGPWLRFLPVSAASILALIGIYRYNQ